MASKRTAPQMSSTERPSTEAQPTKGTWTAAQKLAIIAEYESYPRGDPRRGELLRRVGRTPRTSPNGATSVTAAP